MLKLKLTALAALTLVSGLSLAAGDGRQTYIVQLKAEPAASYQGGVAGLAATRPAPGTTFRYGTAAVQAYVNYLAQQQNTVSATVGQAPVLARYNTVFNGFAARLTPAEVSTLKANANVADVFEDRALKMDTISTHKFLGLSTPGGLWSQTVGGNALKGEGMVVGIVDGGIWPESPAFADRVNANGVPGATGTLAFGAPPASFTGGCVSGEGFNPAIHCNNKLIGAKFYNAGFLAQGLPKNWSEFYSPRDSIGGPSAHGGHGDHTASTAAGNDGAGAVLAGTTLGIASGMAPRARVAAYKVCWTYDDATATDGTGSRNSCWSSDSVAAIDDAVREGVNVINFSISGSQTSVNDPVEQAYYRATLAGVFVAVSAGNSGPANAVAHISPWLTTVAASTHGRAFQATVTLGNGATYSGASVNTQALPATTLIRAEDAGLAGADATQLRLCYSNPVVLDPAKVTGKVVICTRGTTARVDKSLAVANAGGVGMVMMDNGAGLVAEAHSVPTVHVNATDGQAIKDYAVANGAAATAALGTFTLGQSPAPVMAGFSSRGPNQGDSNILKPDVTAPGVDVIATVSPALTIAQRDAVIAGTLVPPVDWASYQGTSMASPHVAGVGALIRQARPGWSPAAIKSALMTTAYTTLDDGLAGLQNGLLPWAQGAGHIDPNKAIEPGLVYDAGVADFASYQCKVNRNGVTAADCATYGTLDETYNLNLASITVGNVVGSTTIRRRVTNVGATAATYQSSINVPGFAGEVSPATLTLAPGETKSFTVKLTATTAVTNAWNYGKLVWNDGTHVVTSPVQARTGKAIAAPLAMTGNTVSGTRLFTVQTGFAGRMGLTKGGLKDVVMVPGQTLTPAAIGSTALRAACAAGTDLANVKVHTVTIPAGTMVARFALRDADVGSPGNDDFDMMMMKSDNTSVVYSGNDGSNEAVQLVAPAAGTYRVCVAAYGTASGASTMSYNMSSWVVTAADTGGAFRVMGPSQVYPGGTATVGFAWSGLTMGHRYVGAAQYLDTAGTVQATTVLRVEPNGGQPVNEVADSNPAKLAGN